METFEAIRTMLAVRAYRDEPLSDEVVRRILEAGRLTASARNRQPWVFVVARERAALARLGGIASRGPYIAQAAMCIAVAVDGSGPSTVDGARAIQDMMLAAWASGVGSNWVTPPPEEQAALREALGLPEERRLLALVPFGYPAQPVGRGKKARKPLGEIACRERFGVPFEE